MAESSSSALARHVDPTARPGLPVLIGAPRPGLQRPGRRDASHEAFGLAWPSPALRLPEGRNREASQRRARCCSPMRWASARRSRRSPPCASWRRAERSSRALDRLSGRPDRAMAAAGPHLGARPRRLDRGRSADQRQAAWRADAALSSSSFESIRADFAAPSVRAARRLGRGGRRRGAADQEPEIRRRLVAVKSLERRRSWALTGTPLENRLDDLISLSISSRRASSIRSAMGVGLRGLMHRVQLRRRRAEVLDDLPPKFASVIGLDLTASQRAAYRKRGGGRNDVAPFAGTGACASRTCSSSFSA